MKKILLLAAISSASVISADPATQTNTTQQTQGSWERSWEDLKKSWGNNPDSETPPTRDESEDDKYPHDTATTDLDKQLNSEIRQKLNGNWFSKGFRHITLNTNNGVVTVSGNVESPDDIQKAIDEIKRVEGVKSVNSHLVVRTR